MIEAVVMGVVYGAALMLFYLWGLRVGRRRALREAYHAAYDQCCNGAVIAAMMTKKQREAVGEEW